MLSWVYEPVFANLKGHQTYPQYSYLQNRETGWLLLGTKAVYFECMKCIIHGAEIHTGVPQPLGLLEHFSRLFGSVCLCICILVSGWIITEPIWQLLLARFYWQRNVEIVQNAILCCHMNYFIIIALSDGLAEAIRLHSAHTVLLACKIGGSHDRRIRWRVLFRR